MADTKISALPTKATPVSADIIPIVDSVGTVNKKVTAGSLPISAATQTALNGKFNNPTGTTSQYIRGDGSIVAFPETVKLTTTVYNQTGSSIPAFSPVYITGQSGGVPTIALARNTNSTEAHLFGITTSAILSGQTGNAVTEGLIEGVDTSSFTAGSMIFLGSTFGSFTATKPTQPTSIVYCGHVIASDATNGSFMVNIINAIRLTELAGLAISSPITGQAIAYNAGAARWENRFLTKTDVGLANVDNTSDANKPVSTAQQTAINAKVADAINDGVTTIAPSQNAVYDALQNKQDYFGNYTPEDVDNKATDLSTIDDTLYPSVKLVNDSFVKKTGDEMTGTLVNQSNDSSITDNFRVYNGNNEGGACSSYENKDGQFLKIGMTGISFTPVDLINPNNGFIKSSQEFSIDAKNEFRIGIDGTQVAKFNNDKFTANKIDALPVAITELDSKTPKDYDELMFYGVDDSKNYKTAFSELPVSNKVFSELENYSKSPQVDTFTTSGTWTKPTGAKLVEVILVGASAGGGSGRVGADGTISTGGGGGGSPAIVHFKFDANDLDATETITVGAAGVGGAAISTNDTDGIDGTSGGETAIGVGINTKLRTYTANAGLGGKLGIAGNGGASSIGATAFNTGQGSGGSSSSTGAIGTSGTNSSGFNTLGGASGGGISSANIPSNGGVGSRWTSISVLPQTSGGAAGTTGGSADAGNGVLNAMRIYGIQLGTGGGGGAGATNRNGGNGGNGVGFSGGGGGGATRNGYTSGQGGNGCDGYAVIITHF